MLAKTRRATPAGKLRQSSASADEIIVSDLKHGSCSTCGLDDETGARFWRGWDHVKTLLLHSAAIAFVKGVDLILN